MHLNGLIFTGLISVFCSLGCQRSGSNKVLRTELELKSRTSRSKPRNKVMFAYRFSRNTIYLWSFRVCVVMTGCSFPALSLTLLQVDGNPCCWSAWPKGRSASPSRLNQSTCCWAVSCWARREPVRYGTFRKYCKCVKNEQNSHFFNTLLMKLMFFFLLIVAVAKISPKNDSLLYQRERRRLLICPERRLWRHGTCLQTHLHPTGKHFFLSGW